MHRSNLENVSFTAFYCWLGTPATGGKAEVVPLTYQGFQLSTVVHTSKMFIRCIIYFVIFFIPCFYSCKTNYPPIEKNNTRIPLTQKKNCSGGSIFTNHETLKCCEEIDGCLYNVISVLMLIVIFLIIFGVFMLCGNWRKNPTSDDNKNKKNNKNNQDEKC